MSNIATVPAHIAARIAARQEKGVRSSVNAALVGDKSGSSIPRISIRAGRYRLNEGGVETTVGVTLDTIIIGANPRVSKVFYAQAFDSSAENVRPACWSNDGLRPDAAIESPVHTQCSDCPNNVLGSKVLPSGAKSKLCADQRHLAVVAAADPSKVYSLTIPVSGMKALREYFQELENYGLAAEEVITELGFDDSASYPKITFSRKGYVPEKAITKVEALAISDATKVATRQLAPKDAGPALGSSASETKAVEHKPTAPAVDEAYEHEEEAPQVVKATSKPAKPVVASVKASDELMSEIDNMFDE